MSKRYGRNQKRRARKQIRERDTKIEHLRKQAFTAERRAATSERAAGQAYDRALRHLVGGQDFLQQLLEDMGRSVSDQIARSIGRQIPAKVLMPPVNLSAKLDERAQVIIVRLDSYRHEFSVADWDLRQPGRWA